MVLLISFIVIAVIVITASVASISVNIRTTDNLYQGTTVYDIAESGAETAMLKLLRDINYAGETLTIGNGQAVITITGTTTKTIVSVGTIGNFSRKIQVTASNINNILTVTSWKEIF